MEPVRIRSRSKSEVVDFGPVTRTRTRIVSVSLDDSSLDPDALEVSPLQLGKDNHHELLRHHGYPRLQLPHWIRAAVAEATGTMVLIILGTGSNINSGLNSDNANYVAYAFGWGIGLMIGLMLSIPISGGHLNPVITLTQAMFRGFPWKQVPLYMLAQLLGAFVGAVINNGVFYSILNDIEGGYGVRTYYGSTATANLFVTVPSVHTHVGIFFSQVLGTALLIVGVAMVTDDDLAGDWSIFVKSMLMMWVLIAVSGCTGVKAAFALNPARDLGPRIACAAFGYPSALWTDRDAFFVWGTMVAPVVGAVIAHFLYDLVVRQGVHLTIPRFRKDRGHTNGSVIEREHHDESVETEVKDDVTV